MEATLARWLDTRSTRDDLLATLPALADDPFGFMCCAGDRLAVCSVAAIVQRHGLGPRLPGELAEALAQVLVANASRNAALADAAKRYARFIARAGVFPVALKGTALIVGRHYDEPGERMTNDIDLLVAPTALRAAVTALRDAGCVQIRDHHALGCTLQDAGEEPIEVDAFRYDPGSVNYHVPVIRHPELRFNLELHTRIGPARLPMTGWLTKALLAEAEPPTTSGSRDADGGREAVGELRLPPPWLLLLHNFHHTHLNDRLAAQGITDWRHLRDAQVLIDGTPDTTLVPHIRTAAAEHAVAAEMTLHLWQVQAHLGTGLPGLDPDRAGRARIRRYRRACSSAGVRRIASLRHHWSRRLRSVFSPAALSQYYGVTPYPVAFVRNALFRARHAAGQPRHERLRRLLLGRR